MKKFHHTNGKKKLPTIPTKEEQSSMKQSIRMRSPINTHHLTAYGPFFLEYSMLAELLVYIFYLLSFTENKDPKDEFQINKQLTALSNRYKKTVNQNRVSKNVVTRLIDGLAQIILRI